MRRHLGHSLQHLTRSLSLALLALLWAVPALADQAVQPCPDPVALIATSRYTRPQKVALRSELTQTLNAKVPVNCLSELTSMALVRGVEAEHLASFYQILRRVKADGLPVSAFANKIAEGLAKGAPGELIDQVLLERERNYLRARQLMVSSMRRRVIYDQFYYQVMELCAEGFRRGLPPQGMGRVFSTKGSLEEMARAMRAYLYLQAIGFPPDVTPDIVVATLESGQFRQCRTCLGQVVFTARRSGAPPRRIRDELVRGLRRGQDLGEISRVLDSHP
jgi:hypothetical protein